MNLLFFHKDRGYVTHASDGRGQTSICGLAVDGNMNQDDFICDKPVSYSVDCKDCAKIIENLSRIKISKILK